MAIEMMQVESRQESTATSEQVGPGPHSIPRDREVCWGDLQELRKVCGLTKPDMVWLFCTSMLMWKRGEEDPAEPVADKAMALMARMLADDTERVEYFVVSGKRKKERQPIPIRDYISETLMTLAPADWKKRHWSVLFGRNASAGYLWLDNGGKAGRIVDNLQLIAENTGGDQFEFLFYYAAIEAAVSGSDPFVTGYWRNSPRDPKS